MHPESGRFLNSADTGDKSAETGAGVRVQHPVFSVNHLCSREDGDDPAFRCKNKGMVNECSVEMVNQKVTVMKECAVVGTGNKLVPFWAILIRISMNYNH